MSLFFETLDDVGHFSALQEFQLTVNKVRGVPLEMRDEETAALHSFLKNHALKMAITWAESHVHHFKGMWRVIGPQHNTP